MKLNKLTAKYWKRTSVCWLASLVSLAGSAQTSEPLMIPLTFSEYIRKTVDHSVEYQAEKLNLSIAKSLVKDAKMMPDPELAFEAADETYTLELGYTFELGGKRKARIQLAKTELERQGYETESFFQELKSQAAEAYLEAILQKKLLEYKQNSYEQMLRIAQSDSLRFRLGEITENEARQSRIEAVTMLNEVYQQRAEYLGAIAELNRFMDEPSDLIFDPVTEMRIPALQHDLPTYTAWALDNRPDLQSSRLEVEKAIRELNLTRAERRMDLGVMVGYERDWKGVLPTNNSIRGGVYIPLKFSNLNKGAVHAARFEVQKNRFDADDKEMRVFTEVKQAYYMYEAAQDQIREFENGLLAESDRFLQGILYMYNRGESDIMEVLFARRTFNEIQELYLETWKDALSSYINLMLTCGIRDWEL